MPVKKPRCPKCGAKISGSELVRSRDANVKEIGFQFLPCKCESFPDDANYERFSVAFQAANKLPG